MALGRLMTVEIRDVGLTRSQAPKMNKHKVPFYYGSLANNTTLGLQFGSLIFWEESNMPAYNKLVRIHCIAGSLSARLAFETRAKCQDFVARFRDDGIPHEIDSPFFNAKNNYQCPPIQIT